jgi:hypothetical protein
MDLLILGNYPTPAKVTREGLTHVLTRKFACFVRQINPHHPTNLFIYTWKYAHHIAPLLYASTFCSTVVQSVVERAQNMRSGRHANREMNNKQGV